MLEIKDVDNVDVDIVVVDVDVDVDDVDVVDVDVEVVEVVNVEVDNVDVDNVDVEVEVVEVEIKDIEILLRYYLETGHFNEHFSISISKSEWNNRRRHQASVAKLGMFLIDSNWKSRKVIESRCILVV